MADQQVYIRLIPRTRSGASRTGRGTRLTPANAATFAADPERAQGALEAATRMGSAALSSRNTIDLVLSPNVVREQFKAELISRTHEPDAEKDTAVVGSYRRGTAYLSVQPKTRLEVPDNLKEMVEFAYVPTPPEFLEHPSPIPPSVSLHHLRLADVALLLGGRRCQRRGWAGKGVRVAMPDTGFAHHPFFPASGFNITRVSTPALPDPAQDASGHGTGECANIFALAPDCRVIGVKHNDYSALAMETALAQAPQVITNSWGWDIDHADFDAVEAADPNFYLEMRDLESIIDDAIADGISVIFSAGNGHKAFPASMPDVLSIGGVFAAENGDLSASNYASSFDSQLYLGRHVPDVSGLVGLSEAGPMRGHIMLPVPRGSDYEGENLPASDAQKGWGIFSGTSAAAPQVAGVVAVLLQLDPSLTPSDIKQILQNTAQDVTTGSSALGQPAAPGPDAATGSGLVDAYAAGEHVAP